MNLHAATSGSPPNSAMQPLPIQPVRPIQLVQPNQGISNSSAPTMSTVSRPQMVAGPPQGLNLSNLPQVLPSGSNGVSFTPQGRAGYTQMGHTGSMESLDSTQSLTLSTYFFGSSTSTGSAHGPLRSSLKKPKNKDIASVSSKSSSKQVRISLGAEQTTV